MLRTRDGRLKPRPRRLVVRLLDHRVAVRPADVHYVRRLWKTSLDEAGIQEVDAAHDVMSCIRRSAFGRLNRFRMLVACWLAVVRWDIPNGNRQRCIAIGLEALRQEGDDLRAAEALL